jgi:hypothetical protein
MNAHPHRYAGYRSPIPNAHIARALGDADDVLREAVKADNLRREAHPANDRAEQYCRNAPDLHETRHYRIGEETLLDLFAGIAFWFLVGIAPALCVLAIMVAK